MAWQVARKLGPLWGLAALFIGIALGSIFPNQLAWLGQGVKSAFGFIADAAPYIIFFTLIPAILGMLATGSAGRFALAVMGAFLATTLIAGLLAVVMLVPIFRLELVAGGGSVGAAFAAMSAQTVLLAQTSPPFIAIWYSSLVAIGLYLGAKTRALRWFAKPTADVIAKVGVDGVERLGRWVQLAFPLILFSIGVFLPTGVREALRSSEDRLTAAGGIADLGGNSPVFWYFVTVFVMVGILAVLVFGGAILACWYTRFPFHRFVKDYLLYVYPFAWATASSAASIPINLDRAKTGLGARKEVRDFIIPLGATVNLDGTMVGSFVVTVVAGMLVGYTPSALDLLLLVLPLTVVSIGIPGIPGGMAAVAPPVIVSILPIPVEAQAAFIAIFFAYGVGLSDQFRTGVNCVNNGILCILFQHWYPSLVQARAPGPAPVGGAAPPEMQEPRSPIEEPKRP